MILTYNKILGILGVKLSLEDVMELRKGNIVSFEHKEDIISLSREATYLEGENKNRYIKKKDRLEVGDE